MAINFRGRANVNYVTQTQLLQYSRDTAKVSSLPLLKITTKSTHILPLKKKTMRQPSIGVLRKRCTENMQQIYRRTLMLKCYFNRFAKELYWNHTSVWVFSWKFAVYFQNTFSLEHLSMAASKDTNTVDWN